MSEDNKSSDFLGLKPYGEAVKILAQGIVNGAGEFLGRLCLPVAEEFGLLLKDHVANWRKSNAIRILAMAEEKIKRIPEEPNLVPNPKVLFHTIEKGSFEENDLIQQYWAGLLADSCSSDGKNDGNIIFMQILERLCLAEVKILNYLCANSFVVISNNGLLLALKQIVPVQDLHNIAGVEDILEMDRILDHLNSLDVLRGGLNHNDNNASVAPSPMCLQLYAKVNAPKLSVRNFYKIENEFDFHVTDTDVNCLLRCCLNTEEDGEDEKLKFVNRVFTLKGVIHYWAGNNTMGLAQICLKSCPESSILYELFIPKQVAQIFELPKYPKPVRFTGRVTKIKNGCIVFKDVSLLPSA